MGIKYIPLYLSYKTTLAPLEDAQLGQVVRAMLDYANGETPPELDGIAQLAYNFLKADFDRAAENYEDRSAQAQANGRKGGAPKGNQNARKQPETTKTTETSYKREREGEGESKRDRERESSSPGGDETMMTEPLKRLLNLCNVSGVRTSPFAKRRLAEAMEKLGTDLTETIISNCLAHSAQQWSYIQTALDRAVDQGLTSVDDYKIRHWRVQNNIVDRIEPSGNSFLGRDDLEDLLESEDDSVKNYEVEKAAAL